MVGFILNLTWTFSIWKRLKKLLNGVLIMLNLQMTINVDSTKSKRREIFFFFSSSYNETPCYVRYKHNQNVSKKTRMDRWKNLFKNVQRSLLFNTYYDQSQCRELNSKFERFLVDGLNLFVLILLKLFLIIRNILWNVTVLLTIKITHINESSVIFGYEISFT